MICSYLREFCQSPRLLQLHEKLLHRIKAGLDSHLESSKKIIGGEGTRGNISLFVLKLASFVLFYEVHFCFNYHLTSGGKNAVGFFFNEI